MAGEMWLTLMTVAIQGQIDVDCHSVPLFSGEKRATTLVTGKSHGRKMKAKRNLKTDTIA